MDPSLSFHKHCNYVTYMIDKRTICEGTGGIILGTGQGDVTADLKRTGEIYRKLCCTSLEHQRKYSSFKKIQTATNAALRTATGDHKMASIDIFTKSLSR